MLKAKRYIMVFLVATALLLATAAQALAASSVNAFIGTKSLDKEDWSPVEDHGAFGVEADLGMGESPLRFSVNLIGSAATDTVYDPLLGYLDVTGETMELQFGIKGVFGHGTVNPFVGGGLAMISAYYEVSDGYYISDDTDSGLGAWLSGGVIFNFGHFNVGMELGFSQADVTLFDVDVNAGGTRFGVRVGGSW